MSTAENLQNFELWFGSQLNTLTRDHHAGFAIAMVTFPLLERYLKQKVRSEPNTDNFNDALVAVLPELQNRTNANLFWAIYRHGLLHNVALSRETHGLSPDKPIVEVGHDGKVWLNPKLFAERVLATIREDFGTFEEGVTLPTVSPLSAQSPDTSIYSPYLGTGMPPGGSRR